MKLKRIAAAVLGACMAVCNIPATVRAEEALPKDNTEAGKKYALCVGVNDYDPSYVGNGLEGCVNDATYMANNLIDRGDWEKDTVTLLTDEKANKDDLRKSIRDYADLLEPGDTFIFQFSGHGFSFTDDEGNYTVKTGICTYNASYYDYELAEDLLNFKSGVNVIVVVDACHSSGLFKDEDDMADDNTKFRDQQIKRVPYEIADSVSDLMDKETKSGKARRAKGYETITSSEIGWATAAQYYEYSFDGGFYDFDSWMFSNEPLDGEIMGGVFLAAFTWSWWNGTADTMLKGDGDGYVDTYECWAYSQLICNEWGFSPCCKNIDVLKSVKLGWAGENAPTEDVIIDPVPATKVMRGEKAELDITARNPEGVEGNIEVTVANAAGQKEKFTFKNGHFAFTPKTDGNYTFIVTATNEKTGKSSSRAFGVTSMLPAPTAHEAIDVSGRAFTANWSEVDDIKWYDIQITTNEKFCFADENDALYFDEVPAGTTEYSLDSLNGDTKYYYRVRSHNNIFSDWSDIVMVKTNELLDAKVIKLPSEKDEILEYNGQEQELIIPGKVEGGEYIYSVIGPCWDISVYNSSVLMSWDSEVPTAEEAGRYWVFYQVSGDTDHNDGEMDMIMVEIMPKPVTEPTIILEKDFYIYDGKEKTPAVIVKDGDTVIPSNEYAVFYNNNKKAGTATVEICDEFDGNYLIVDSSKTFVIGTVDVKWYWNGTNDAVAVFTDPSGSGFRDSVNAKVTSKVVKNATCDKAGTMRYTATVTYNGQKYTDTKTVKIPAAGHDYGNPKWTWSEGGKAVAVFTCKNDSSHTKSMTATVTSKVSKEATVNAAGTMVYTATVTLNGKVYKNNKTEKYYLFDKSVTGLQMYKNTLYYTKNGVQSSYTGFGKYGSDWYFAVKGKVDTTKRDVLIGDVNGISGWWYVKNGKVQFVNSVEKNANGWWAIRDGKVDFKFTGLARNEYGWWYCKNGKVNFSYTGVAKNEYGWWYCKDGKADFSYTGLGKNEYGWWYCKNGKVDFTFTGIAENQYGQWYCYEGKIRFDYSGSVMYKGKLYTIKEGKVVK